MKNKHLVGDFRVKLSDPIGNLNTIPLSGSKMMAPAPLQKDRTGNPVPCDKTAKVPECVFILLQPDTWEGKQLLEAIFRIISHCMMLYTLILF